MTTLAQAQPETDGLPLPQRIFAVAALLTALVLVVLDGVITNVALPTITQSLDITPAMSVWVVTAYQMGLVTALLPCGALGESIGFKRVFTGGVLLFTFASALCALSPSLPWLAAARFVQGIGGACVMSLCVALLRFTVPQHKLGAAIGWNALTIALSSAAGPAIGAGILTSASWPWLFAVNIPVGILALIGTRALPNVAGNARSIDLVSVALNGCAFISLVVGVDLLPSSREIGTLLLAVALASLAALIRREMPRQAPLIPIDLLRNPSFRISVIASVLCFAGQTAGIVMLPFYLQHSLAQSTLMTGLFMTPWPLTVAVAAPLAGRLSNRFSTGALCAGGGSVLAMGLVTAALWPFQNGLLPLVPITMLCGAGFGFFQVPNNRNMLLSAPRERSGAAGGMQGTARLVGQTAGAVGVTLLFILTSTSDAPRIGLAIGGVLTLAGGLVSLLRVK